MKMTPEHIARMATARRSAVKNGTSGRTAPPKTLPEGGEAMRREFTMRMPSTVRARLAAVYAGKSRAWAMKLKCLDCCCSNKAEVGRCQIAACPLWPYRPYQRDEEITLDEGRPQEETP